MSKCGVGIKTDLTVLYLLLLPESDPQRTPSRWFTQGKRQKWTLSMTQ
jgi:hypothetical protein